MNHARYLDYFQLGRWKWLEWRGISIQKLEKETKTILVVVNINLTYHRELRYGEEPRVITTVARKGEKVLLFQQTLALPDEIVVADGVITMVSVSTETRKSKPLPEALLKVLKQD